MNKVKCIALCLALVFAVVGLVAQTPEWLWAVRAGGTGDDRCSSIATDTLGNQYVTGYFQGTAVFGPYTLTSSGYSDIFVAKLDPAGNYLWVVKAGGTSDDGGCDIAVDGVGNAYLTGFFYTTALLGPFTLTSDGSNDIFIAKLDSNGNWLWAVQAGGTGGDTGYALALDSIGNVYLCGWFDSTTATFNTFALTSSGGYDIFAAKLDSDGNFLWAVRAGGTSDDRGNDIALDSGGNAFLTGNFFGVATFGPYTLTTVGPHDFFTAKIDPTGNFIWAVKGGGSFIGDVQGLSVDSTGNAFLTGEFFGVATFGTYTITSSGGLDIFAAKLDSDGTFLWAVRAGGTGADQGYGITVDSAGNASLTGYFSENASFGPFTLTPSGNYDIFATQLDLAGNFLWAIKAGGVNNDFGEAIAMDSAGNTYLTGIFHGTTTFGPFSLTASGNYDVFIVKISSLLNANFTADSTSGPEPLSVQFTDQSTSETYPITNWIWSFGDGESSTQQNPIHTYLTPGVYTVSLTVMDQAYRTSTLVRPSYITVLEWIYAIELITPVSINYGTVFLEEQSDYQTITFTNTGTVGLSISDVHFFGGPLHFEFIDPIPDLVLPPGESGSMLVRFAPQSVGALSDTLYIVNNSSNLPILKVRLQGYGEYVPPKPPENVVITMDGDNAVITWDAVTQNIHDQTIVPDGYLVIYNGSSDAENGLYYYLAVTNGLTQTHIRVGEFADYMFYRVKAYKYYGRGAFDITSLGLEPGMPESEVFRLLNQ